MLEQMQENLYFKHFWFLKTYISNVHPFFFTFQNKRIYTVSQKKRTPATFYNNSNSPGSIAIDFDKNNR